MLLQDQESNLGSESSTTGITSKTPGSGSDATSTERVEAWHSDDEHDIPYPENTYLILKHKTHRAITLGQGGALRLVSIDVETSIDPNSLWRCVWKDGYFGFLNQRASKYIGHDGTMWGESRIFARVSHLNAHELFTPRRSPEGGYHLLCPHYWYALRMVNVVGEDDRLVRTDRGNTTWDFVKMNPHAG